MKEWIKRDIQEISNCYLKSNAQQNTSADIKGINTNGPRRWISKIVKFPEFINYG